MTNMSNQKEAAVKKAQVELDIFSGRPNPKWSLSSKDTKTLAAMIEKLPRTKSTSIFDGLGYRGFVVNSSTPIAGVNSIKIYKQVVKLDAANYRKDSDKTIERWLLTKAESALSKEEYRLAAKEIKDID